MAGLPVVSFESSALKNALPIVRVASSWLLLDVGAIATAMALTDALEGCAVGTIATATTTAIALKNQ